ncbi:microtubule organization protein AKNA [Salarias fasciatus]|uniref:microtubule organization protein AKNA n=1 Tax=Salarias fasciatus TaxID=181472 RepID=UPI0011765F62|nr:microtubule organization protein AKNA-like [Salarias fasciatus]
MEAEPEDSDGDVQRDGRLTLLWERHIQQSIVVDLSEDESLHLSDLQSSVALRLSRAESEASEASVHLRGSAELSAFSESSSVSSRSEKVQVDRANGSMCQVSAQRPNTVPDELPVNQRAEDGGGSTSDEDQEDLPYDGSPASCSFDRTAGSEGDVSSEGPRTVRRSPEAAEAAPRCPADVSQVLLRHFSQEELLRPGWLLQTETLPEVSLLDSVDETVLSSAKTHRSDASRSAAGPGSDEEPGSAAAADSRTSSPAGPDPPQTPEQTRAEEETPLQRAPLLRTTSFSEMKYGQGQVHYPLPDFSKVQPKVKIPKAPSGAVRPALQGPGVILRAQSSPGMLDVVSRVLEDSCEPPEKPFVFTDRDRQTPPALVHHLQAEYDKLLTKYAEAENIIDQMRLEPNTQPCSDLGHDGPEGSELVQESRLRRPAPPGSSSLRGDAAAGGSLETTARCRRDGEDNEPSDGQRMTSDLRSIVSQFMRKMLRSMMEAQDQLERSYISRKEEHRALEMQNHMGLCRNTGTFDPSRLVEGDIFRIGMHLDEIKEAIDRNVCEQISPPHSSSTLPSDPASPAPPLQQEEEELKGRSTEPICADSSLTTPGPNSCLSWTPRGVLGGPGAPSAEDEEGDEEERSSVWTEAIDHSDILAYLSATGRRSRADSRRSPEGVRSPGAGCDPGHCEPPFGLSAPRLNASCSQRIVSPETDSGFGSSYLTQSSSGLSPPPLLGRAESQDGGSVSSGSDASSLQAASAGGRGAASAVERWVESTAKESSVRLRGSELQPTAPPQPHTSPPGPSSTMETEEPGPALQPCSCNSEAILALQSEVSRMKKDLEEGLVQLPHLAQKMDYLTSKYRQERDGRRSKTRSHQKPASDR